MEDRRAQAGRPPRDRVAHPGRRLHLGVDRPRRDGGQGPARLGGGRGQAPQRRLRPADPRRAHLRREVRLGAAWPTWWPAWRSGRPKTNVVVTGRDAPEEIDRRGRHRDRDAQGQARLRRRASRRSRASSSERRGRRPAGGRRHPLRRRQDDGGHRAHGRPRRPRRGRSPPPRSAPTSSTPATTPWPPAARAATSTPGWPGRSGSPRWPARAGAGRRRPRRRRGHGPLRRLGRPVRAGAAAAPPSAPACSTPPWCWWSTPAGMSRSVAAMVARLRPFRPADQDGAG